MIELGAILELQTDAKYTWEKRETLPLVKSSLEIAQMKLLMANPAIKIRFENFFVIQWFHEFFVMTFQYFDSAVFGAKIQILRVKATLQFGAQ